MTKIVRIAPDRALVYFLVEESGETPVDATQRASEKLQAVRDAVQRSGVALEGVLALPYGIMPPTNSMGRPGPAAQTSFVARFALRVQLTRLDLIPRLAATAMAAGAAATAAPVFEASAMDSARRARYAEALVAARQDAEALASSLGGRIGPLIEVASSGQPGLGFTSPYINFNTRYDGGQMQSPDVQVSATVTVRYRFIPK